MADDSVPTVDTTSTPPVSSPEPAATPPASTGETARAPSPSAPTTPTDNQGETRETLLQAVQKAVPELRTSQTDQEGPGGVPLAPASRSETAKYPDEAPAGDGDLPEEVTPEELAQFSPPSKRRVEKLLDQRRALRADVERLKALEPSAKAAASVTEYLRANDIGQDDFLLTLELAAAMRRGDFKTFYEGVRPYMQLAEEYLGVQLPADLQQRVNEGHMTSQAARLFARERMDRMLAESQRVRQAQQYEQTTTVSRQTQLANSVAAEVDRWEQAVMKADPDYVAKKQAAVQDTMWAVVREKGRPQSPEHAVAIANEALRRVNERYRSWVPPARPTSLQPRSTGKTNGAAPEARTLLEAVQQARESARA
jgi:hypothetical protein